MITAKSIPYATVKFDEKVEMQAMVESIDVEDHDLAIDRASIVFDSGDDVAKVVREQSKVQINLGWTSENALIFEGIVAGVKAQAAGTGTQRVTVTAYDMSYLLKQQQSKDRVFSSGKLSDALKTILNDYSGIAVDAKNIALDPDPPLTPGKPWRKTSGTSDWDFIQEAAAKWRARAFVEVNNNKSQFYFVAETKLLQGAAMGLLRYHPGGVGPLIEFDYQRVASGASAAASVTVDDPDSGAALTIKAPQAAPDQPVDLGSKSSDRLARAGGILANSPAKPADARPKIVLAGEPSDSDRAGLQTKPDPTRSLGYSGRGEAVGTVMLRAKGKVTIEGLSPWADGDWYVHRVNHVYTRVTDPLRPSTFRTKFSATR